MRPPYRTFGFLYHPLLGKLLLHHRDEQAPTNPGLWAPFGGDEEDEAGGDPVATWRREMREELDASGVIPLCDYPARLGGRRYVHYSLRPDPRTDFTVGEGQGIAWDTVDGARWRGPTRREARGATWSDSRRSGERRHRARRFHRRGGRVDRRAGPVAIGRRDVPPSGVRSDATTGTTVPVVAVLRRGTLPRRGAICREGG